MNLAERTRISGAEIPAARMLDYIERLRAIYDRAGIALTFFEFTVAMMFLYFAEEQRRYRNGRDRDSAGGSIPPTS